MMRLDAEDDGDADAGGAAGETGVSAGATAVAAPPHDIAIMEVASAPTPIRMRMRAGLAIATS
jgi:hypothetical protein